MTWSGHRSRDRSAHDRQRLSSGGVLAAWLSAYAKPDQVRAAVEDPPLFASEARTSCGQPINHGLGQAFALWNKWLGDQWSIGDWEGMQAAVHRELPRPVLRALGAMMPPVGEATAPNGPPQNLKEYDPEWSRSFVSGLATAACDHATMASARRRAGAVHPSLPRARRGLR